MVAKHKTANRRCAIVISATFKLRHYPIVIPDAHPDDAELYREDARAAIQAVREWDKAETTKRWIRLVQCGVVIEKPE